MRILCTCTPGYGHLHPMVPLATALQGAGHEVAFATDDRFSRRAEQAGFAAFRAGLGPGEVFKRMMASCGGDPPADAWSFGAALFAGVAAPAKVPALAEAVDAWRPALVIHEMTDFAGPVAAAHACVPSIAHTLGPLFPDAFYRAGADLVAPLWADWGVTPGPLGGMFGTACLDIAPPSLRAPVDGAVEPLIRALRPVSFDAVGEEDVPAWVNRLPAQPTVYVTLGTLDNDAPDVFAAVLAGLRDQAVNVIVSVGPDADAGALGPQPPHVHVVRCVPQSRLFSRCDVVVSHGGSGTMLAALAHAVPMVMLPQGANQFWNADRCVALGVAASLRGDEVHAEAVRAAIQLTLTDPDFRRRAADLAAEIAAMPAPAEAVALLEAVTRR